ncbi:metal ABC transporter substrate-binding protein [Actinoplanes sp. NPDC049265]|uniref:metal ABC transporter substrate-binding protein n=1 Tax=Actinoplanes sp. NPDC049265 TaxID=3363902 RepID=UPI0037104499
MRTRLAIAALLLLLAAGCGTGASGSGDDRPQVVTAFYPLQFLTERVGGGQFQITDLTKPGAEPHDVELNPRQVGSISDAELVVYLEGFQPAVDQAVAQEAHDKSLDVGGTVELLTATGDHEHLKGGKDPHIWLDPVRFATITDRVGERLAQVDPAHAADHRARAQAVHAELDQLNRDYAAGLKTCQRREIVTSHTAFAYLAARYDLHEVGITGISPEAEASPQRLAGVAREARATGATTIFFETLVSPKVAETIAQEVGARTAVLDPIEGRTDPNADYFSMMRANLAALTQALGCSR